MRAFLSLAFFAATAVSATPYTLQVEFAYALKYDATRSGGPLKACRSLVEVFSGVTRPDSAALCASIDYEFAYYADAVSGRLLKLISLKVPVVTPISYVTSTAALSLVQANLVSLSFYADPGGEASRVVVDYGVASAVTATILVGLAVVITIVTSLAFVCSGDREGCCSSARRRCRYTYADV